MAGKDNKINADSAKIHRKSINETFGVKAATEPVKKPDPLEAEAKDLQALLGDEVVVKPSNKMAKGGSASSRADGIAVRGKTRGKMC
jgi:hypothetical protein